MKQTLVHHRVTGIADLSQRSRLPADPFSYIEVLAQTAIDDRLRVLGKDCANEQFAGLPEKSPANIRLREMAAICRELDLPGNPSIEGLPRGSFALNLPFRLASPYISRDDVTFHVTDNPVKKDKVLKLPMISPQSWKGNLTFAAFQSGLDRAGSDASPLLRRLFGNDTEEKKHLHQGRLYFFPTFFDRVGLEIINPHDRKRRVGVNPIYFECVPAGASGRFRLLYVARGGAAEAADDLRFIAPIICAMLLDWGFSSKKTSGYGTVEDHLPARATLEAAGAGAPLTFNSVREIERRAARLADAVKEG